jgi:ferredoxin
MVFKIVVDADACIGCGACASACETGFKMEDNKSVPFKNEVVEISCHNEAVDVCPVNCIKITEK